MKFLVPCGIPNHMLSSATTRYMDMDTFHLFFFFFCVEDNDVDAGLFKILHFNNCIVFIVE